MSSRIWRTFLRPALVGVLVSAPLQAQIDPTWVAKYVDPTTTIDAASEVAYLPGGDFVVAGYCTGPGSNTTERDFLTIRYTAQGQQVWARRYDGPLHDADVVSALAIDPSGNVIVAGLSQGTLASASDGALAVCKYAPDGTLLWVRRYEELGPNWSSWGQWGGMDLDAAGNIYLAGNTHLSTPGATIDIVTMAYAPDGTLLWTATYDGPAAGLDVAQDLVVSRTGQVLVTGLTEELSGRGCTTLAHALDGTPLWTAFELNGGYEGYRIAADPDGNAYVLSSEWSGGATGIDLMVLSYDTSGGRRWKTVVAGPGDYEELPSALQPGTSGDLYVTALTRPITYPMRPDILTLRIGPHGDPLWVQTYGSSGLDEISRALAVDGAGNVYVTGETWYWDKVSAWHTFLTLKYTAAGGLDWWAHWGEPTGPFQQPLAAAYGLGLAEDASFLIATGASINECTTLRYDQHTPPVVYCTSRPSSIAGCMPSVGGSSSLVSLSAGAGSWDLVCAPVPGGTPVGIALASTAGPLAAPVAGPYGWLCIASGAGWFRLPAAQPGGTSGSCDGVYVFDVGGWLAAQAGHPALVPGGTLDLQAWYRDTPNPGGADLSNALSLQLVP